MARAADQFEDIRVAAVKLRGAKVGCPRWADPAFLLTNCWCHCSGFNGATLPCPELPPEKNESAIKETEPFHLPGVTRVPWFPTGGSG
jgi:hypothetical protein